MMEQGTLREKPDDLDEFVSSIIGLNAIKIIGYSVSPEIRHVQCENLKIWLSTGG